jgi:hypothetical protein
MKKNDYVIKRIGVADTPIPSTVALAKFSYPNQFTIIKVIENLINKKIKITKNFKQDIRYDQPNKNFIVPF